MSLSSPPVRTGMAMIVLGSLLAACGGGKEQPVPDAGPARRGADVSSMDPAAEQRLRDLDNVDVLRQAFNDGAGKPRLVLLLSPT